MANEPVLRYTAPFDRHDWVVDRCGTRVRYIIDFYASKFAFARMPSFYLTYGPHLMVGKVPRCACRCSSDFPVRQGSHVPNPPSDRRRPSPLDPRWHALRLRWRNTQFQERQAVVLRRDGDLCGLARRVRSAVQAREEHTEGWRGRRDRDSLDSRLQTREGLHAPHSRYNTRITPTDSTLDYSTRTGAFQHSALQHDSSRSRQPLKPVGCTI
jgi:hypothetical protein